MSKKMLGMTVMHLRTKDVGVVVDIATVHDHWLVVRIYDNRLKKYKRKYSHSSGLIILEEDTDYNRDPIEEDMMFHDSYGEAAIMLAIETKDRAWYNEVMNLEPPVS